MKKTRKKVNKKINKNVSNIIRSQNGGLLFDIHPNQLEKLVHIGQKDSLGNELSCGACALNQLNFPKNIVNELSIMANNTGQVSFKTMLEKINLYGLSGDIYIWSLDDNWKVDVTKYDIPHDQWLWEIDSIENTKAVLEAIFQTLNKGTATVLGIIWEKEIGGHYTVIAKSQNGTPYLIEAQNIENDNFQGVYKGIDQIIDNYFNYQVQVAYLMTFNNNKPKYNKKSKTWTLNEPVINLLTKKDSTNLIHRDPLNVDETRTMQLPSEALKRYSSFRTPANITHSSHSHDERQHATGRRKSMKKTKRKSRKHT